MAEFPFGLDETGYERYLEARDEPPDEYVYCPECGQRIGADEVPCPYCGARP